MAIRYMRSATETSLGTFATSLIPFVSKWKTDNAGTSTSTQITLPLVPSGTYAFDVDWGDDSQDTITAYNQSEITHTYSVAGTYTVTITGTCTGFRFNNGGDRLKLVEVTSCGILRLGNTGGYFYGAANMVWAATDPLDLTGTTNLSTAFRACTVFNGAIGNWDVSGVASTAYMFYYASAFNQDISTWDVSGVASMAGMFYYAEAFNQSIGNWDVSGVSTMTSMFRASAFNQDISNWDVSGVSATNYMFYYAPAFNQDISNWDISNVTDMTQMLAGSAHSTANYDLLLVAWALKPLQSGVAFGTSAKYSAGAPATAKGSILSTYSWTITDSGQV